MKGNAKEMERKRQGNEVGKNNFVGVVYHTVNQRWKLVKRGSSHF